jgi:hypothetical protein
MRNNGLDMEFLVGAASFIRLVEMQRGEYQVGMRSHTGFLASTGPAPVPAYVEALQYYWMPGRPAAEHAVLSRTIDQVVLTVVNTPPSHGGALHGSDVLMHLVGETLTMSCGGRIWTVPAVTDPNQARSADPLARASDGSGFLTVIEFSTELEQAAARMFVVPPSLADGLAQASSIRRILSTERAESVV